MTDREGSLHEKDPNWKDLIAKNGAGMFLIALGLSMFTLAEVSGAPDWITPAAAGAYLLWRAPQ